MFRKGGGSTAFFVEVRKFKWLDSVQRPVFMCGIYVKHFDYILSEFGVGFQITIVRSNTDVISIWCQMKDWITSYTMRPPGWPHGIWWRNPWRTILSLISRAPKAENVTKLSAPWIYSYVWGFSTFAVWMWWWFILNLEWDSFMKSSNSPCQAYQNPLFHSCIRAWPH